MAKEGLVQNKDQMDKFCLEKARRRASQSTSHQHAGLHRVVRDVGQGQHGHFGRCGGARAQHPQVAGGTALRNHPSPIAAPLRHTPHTGRCAGGEAGCEPGGIERGEERGRLLLAPRACWIPPPSRPQCPQHVLQAHLGLHKLARCRRVRRASTKAARTRHRDAPRLRPRRLRGVVKVERRVLGRRWCGGDVWCEGVLRCAELCVFEGDCAPNRHGALERLPAACGSHGIQLPVLQLHDVRHAREVPRRRVRSLHVG